MYTFDEEVPADVISHDTAVQEALERNDQSLFDASGNDAQNLDALFDLEALDP